jgi:hypothetical protein
VEADIAIAIAIAIAISPLRLHARAMGSVPIRSRFFDLPIGARILVQVLAVISCATVGSFVVGRLRFGSPWNLTWVALLPALIGILLNRGTTNRITFPVFWVVLSFVTVGLLVNVAGLGPD